MKHKITYRILFIILNFEENRISRFARTLDIAVNTAVSWRDGVTRPNAEHLERILDAYPGLTIDMIQQIGLIEEIKEEIDPELVISADSSP